MAKTDIEKLISKMYKAVFDHTIDVNELPLYSEVFTDYYIYLMDMKEDGFRKINHNVLAKYIELALIYYTYSEYGGLLISESHYFNCMQIYTSLGYPQITTTEYEPKADASKKWTTIPHDNPNMVGSLDKEYGIASFVERLLKMTESPGATGEVVFVPKYDGASCCINIKDGFITNAVTRKDGKNGLDITKIVKGAKNYNEILAFIKMYSTRESSGALKCEMLCASEDFTHLSDEYANRRSATSAIVANPKNTRLAKYLTIMPIMLHLSHPDESWDDSIITKQLLDSGYSYVNPFWVGHVYEKEWVEEVRLSGMRLSEACQLCTPIIEDLINFYRFPAFPFRVDGVVAHCLNRKPENFNEDAMATTLAYKVNTETGITRVIDGYISIGRGGRATPMVKVEPCDCNETIVQDVSLSTMSKAKKFDLCIGDTIEIESAGDVIPMVKRVVKHKKHSEPIRFKNKCPYCGEPLEKISDELIGCTNKRCPRIISGQAATFFERMGVKGFSDLTFDNLLRAKEIHSSALWFIENILKWDIEDLKTLEGWDVTKASNFVEATTKLRNTPIDEAKFLSAINIPDVGPKTAQKIIEKVPFTEISHYVSKGKPSFLEDALMDADGCGYKTAQKIAEFIFKRWDDIMRIKSLCNIVPYTKHIRSFALTGFSGAEKDEIARDLEVLGYDTGGVTKGTIACIALNPAGSSDKIKKAQKYGIPIISRNDIKRFIETLN